MGSSNIQFTADDLRAVIGLCETDHKLTDLMGMRMPLPDMIRHRYRVSAIAHKANILLMQIQAQEQAESRLMPAEAAPETKEAPANGARV